MKTLRSLLVSALFLPMLMLGIFTASGCNLSNNDKLLIVSSAIKIAATAGTKVAVKQSPKSGEYLPLVADALVALAGQDGIDGAKLTKAINAIVSEKIPEENRLLVSSAIGESVGLLTVFLNENSLPKFDQSKKQAVIALASGIRLGLSASSTAEISAKSPEFAVFRLH